MAYILGLMMTDGCISKTKNGSYRISLCLNDGDLLKKVAKTMGSEHAITESKYQKGLNVLIFGREKIAQDLIRLGMKPRKSLDLEFPKVPMEYLRDFIRGVFDGDGSVFYTKQSKNSPLISKFYTASENFIVGLSQALELLGMPKKQINCETKNRKHPYYYIRYSHLASLKLYQIMYAGIRGGLYLERKFNRFKAVIDSSLTQ